MPDRSPILCDCCGTEKLAERVGEKIVIQRFRNGKLHIAVINLSGKCYSEVGESVPEPPEPAETGQSS